MGLRFREKSQAVLLYLGSERFLGHVSLQPEWADIRVTESCNSRCVTCQAWKNKADDELSTEEMKDAIHQLSEVGVRNAVFIGGEPLLRRDIGVLVKEASVVGFRNIMVVTNGLLLEDKAEELLRSGVTHVTVSVDGLGATDDRIRGVSGSFDRAVKGVKAVQRLKKDLGLNVAVTLITTLLLKENAEEIPKIVELARSLGAHWMFNLLDPNIDIFRGIPFSKLLEDDERKIDATIDYLKRACRQDPDAVSSCDHMLEFARGYLKTPSKYDFHCIHGYKMLYLGSHGEVYLGCYALDPIGNIRKDRLKDLVGSKAARQLAKKMYKMDCPGCTNRYEFNLAVKHLISHQLFCERRKKAENWDTQRKVGKP